MSAKGYTKTDEALNRLTEHQRQITQEDGTEPAYDNEYWANDEPGIYVDIVSGQPLFSSNDKYDSGTGWPSFWGPIDEKALGTKTQGSGRFLQTEVHCRRCGGHLKHAVNPVGGPFAVASFRCHPCNHAPQVLQQSESQHDRDCPKLAKPKRGHGLI